MRKFRLEDLIIYFLTVVLTELLLSFLFCTQTIIDQGVRVLWRLTYTGDFLILRWILALILGVLFSSFIYDSWNSKGLNDIKLKTAGNGQFGTARWLSEKRFNELFKTVKASSADTPGFVIKCDKNRFTVDTSDQNAIIYAPPGSMKTKGINIPGIYYNALVNKNTGGNGASMILVDVKGEEYETTSAELEACGYETVVIDFRNPMLSDRYNIMNEINGFMDIVNNSENEYDRIVARSRAEECAQQLSKSICSAASSKSTSEASEYFKNTAEGLTTALILLVSEHGAPEERHIISVFMLIIELNGLIQNEGTKKSESQKNKLKELLEIIPESVRIKMHSGASFSADVKTSMNIFSSALSKLLGFVNPEIEQMICRHTQGLEPKLLVEKPVAFFIIIPDYKNNLDFFSSLLIRQFLDSLMNEANNYPQCRLPRQIQIWWDEFGNSPYVQRLAKVVTAARSRNIRLFLTLQSHSQLNENYPRSEAETIQENIQLIAFAAPGADAYKTAKGFSDLLGKYTTQSGSISTGKKSNSKSQSIQLMGRELLTPNEILSLPQGTFVFRKTGEDPFKISVRLWWECFSLKPFVNNRKPHNIVKIPYLSEEKLKEKYGSTVSAEKSEISSLKGVFDEERLDDTEPVTVSAQNAPPAKPKKRLGRKKTTAI